jgi:catechol-2,3-dioxygenase
LSPSFDRRMFLRRAATVLPLMHAAPPLFAIADSHDMSLEDPPSPTRPSARFARLRLLAQPMEAMEHFYRETLNLPVSRAKDSLHVTAGETAIEFAPAQGDSKPYYHFAFNIPHNKLESAIKWMDGRAPLVPRNDGGGVIFHFQHWDAHAIYFLDPAGNIVEFIARHTLKNDVAGDFSEHDILCASEIGVVSPDVVSAADQLCHAVKLQRYHGGSADFTAVGDEHGLFIVVKTGRKWFSSDRAAEVFEAEAFVREKQSRLTLDASAITVEGAKWR